MQTNLERTTEILLHLLSCGLHGKTPTCLPQTDAESRYLFALADYHQLAPMVAMVLESAGFQSKQWTDAKNQGIRRALLMDIERKAIYAQLEQQNIWYVPLKGSVLQAYYPKMGMRQMSDCDILFDSTQSQAVIALFEKRGYRLEHPDDPVHLVFLKEPMYNYEMHMCLFAESRFPRWAAFFRESENRLLSDPSCPSRRRFSNEDFYIHFILHAFKHYSNRGTGLRTLVDLYVLIHTFGEQMDWDYIQKVVTELDVDRFEHNSRSLATAIFTPDAVPPLRLSDRQNKRLLFYVQSGIYGIQKHMMESQIRAMTDDGVITKRTKLHYLLRRIFPGRQWCREPHPLFYRFPILLPILWLYRIFRTLLFRFNSFIFEMKTVFGAGRH